MRISRSIVSSVTTRTGGGLSLPHLRVPCFPSFHLDHITSHIRSDQRRGSKGGTEYSVKGPSNKESNKETKGRTRLASSYSTRFSFVESCRAKQASPRSQITHTGGLAHTKGHHIKYHTSTQKHLHTNSGNGNGCLTARALTDWAAGLARMVDG